MGLFPFLQDPFPLGAREAQFFQRLIVGGPLRNGFHSCTLPVPPQSGQRTLPSPGSCAMPIPAQLGQFSDVVVEGVTLNTSVHVRFFPAYPDFSSMPVLPL
jgi:hypothetical protein